MKQSEHDDSPTVRLQVHIDESVAHRMATARTALQHTIATVSQSAFVNAALQHYINHLADELNDGKDWSTGDRYGSHSVVTDASGRTAIYQPTVHWARVPTKRQPTQVELARQLNQAIIIVGEIRPAPPTTSQQRSPGYRKLLKSAGLEIDPERDEIMDSDGSYLIPIRARTT